MQTHFTELNLTDIQKKKFAKKACQNSDILTKMIKENFDFFDFFDFDFLCQKYK